jgi:hypothetical protein
MKKPVSRNRVEKRPAPRRANSAADEILPEYDFSNATPNPYTTLIGSGMTVVVLDADVAEIFPDAQSVNEALRTLARIAKQPSKRSKPRHRRTA